MGSSNLSRLSILLALPASLCFEISVFKPGLSSMPPQTFWLMNYEDSTNYANSVDCKGQSPVLQASIDPSVFQDTSMWVGITATSGSGNIKPSIRGTSRPLMRPSRTNISLLLKSSNPPNHEDLGFILGISFSLLFLTHHHHLIFHWRILPHLEAKDI